MPNEFRNSKKAEKKNIFFKKEKVQCAEVRTHFSFFFGLYWSGYNMNFWFDVKMGKLFASLKLKETKNFEVKKVDYWTNKKITLSRYSSFTR